MCIRDSRVVVYNPAPSANVAASFAIGQPDLDTATPGTNYGAASYLKEPTQVSHGGSQFFITDSLNNRVLVFNSLPVSTGAVPSFRIRQILITDSSANQGGASPNPNSLSGPRALAFRSGKLAIADSGNHRLTF